MTAQDKTFGAALPPWPQVDFGAFGDVERKPLPRVQQLTGGFLARNYVMIPHVTHHDLVDISNIDARRKQSVKDTGVRVTLLPLLVKAVVEALREYPQFNASLDVDGKTLVLKKYFHIGIAVDTPNGLLVPVLHDSDKKSVAQLADEINARAAKAREKGLSIAEMSGGCFSISSLGHLGGTGFTPIINAPEVAILGVTQSRLQPQHVDGTIALRLMLPLSLSYDHRIINGADAARFVARLGTLLQDRTMHDKWFNPQ